MTEPRTFLDHLNDWGAALTVYAGVSLLPALVIVIGALGLLGDSTLDGSPKTSCKGHRGPCEACS